MTALTPVSLLGTAGKLLGQVASDVAQKGQGKPGLAGAFSDAWMGLDANKDGTLDGKDVLGHAVGARDAVLQGIADSFGYDTGPAARARRAQGGGSGAATDATYRIADRVGPGAERAAQALFTAAHPALPSSPAARAVENLPGVEQVRATYAALRSWH